MPERIPAEPVNIQTIKGCGRAVFPTLIREGDEVVCVRWETEVRGIKQLGRCPLDEVDEGKQTALCSQYSDCIYYYDNKTAKLIRGNPTAFIQYLREHPSY